MKERRKKVSYNWKKKTEYQQRIVTFVIKETVLGENEPTFLPQHETLRTLLMQPALKCNGGGKRPFCSGRTQSPLRTAPSPHPRYGSCHTRAIVLATYLDRYSGRCSRLDNLQNKNAFSPTRPIINPAVKFDFGLIECINLTILTSKKKSLD